MKTVSHPIKPMNRALCSALMLLTPERSVITRAQQAAEPLTAPAHPTTMP